MVLLLVRKNFLFLAIICFLFLFLAINYERSDIVLKRMEQDIVASAKKTGVHQGDLAVDFQLLNGDGEKVLLSDFRGKKVIVNFFASWCAPCQEEMPVLVQLDSRMDKEKAVILGVNVTKEEPNPNQVREFIKHFKVEYDVLFDGNGKVMKDYQLIGIPTTLFINEKGEIVLRLNGMLTMDMVTENSFFDGIIK